MTSRFATAVAATSLVLAAAVAPAPPASAAPGPELQQPAGKLRKATDCQGPRKLASAKGVVLLVHGTGEKQSETWSWSYQPALHADGYATCTVQLPDHGLGDFDVAVEYVVAAVRTAYRKADRPIAVVGHSQGGALPVWALKFWPDLDAKVTDVVSLGGPFGGTQIGNEFCSPGQCAPLAWELRVGARHVAALRNAPMPGSPVTSIASLNDEIVRPQPAASELPGATNLILQDHCVTDPSEHAMLLGDPLAYALALDAISHAGPADPSRLPADICQQAFIPHGDPAGSYVFLQGVARFFTGLGDPNRWVDREPRVPAYARAYVD